MLGVDSVQSFAGVDLKLLAFRKVLEENPHLVRNTVFVQILVSRHAATGAAASAAGRRDAGGARKQHRRVRRDLLDIAAGINARFHTPVVTAATGGGGGGASSSSSSFARVPGRVLEVVEYEEAEFTLPVRMAWLAAADVLMCVPVREGFNRIPLEFVAAQ